MRLEILQTDIKTVVEVSGMIPELVDPYQADEYHRRLSGKRSLLLVAYADGEPAGFKAGYDKFGDGSFYSWMGGVLPAYRNRHIATVLAAHQEQWAKVQGFKSIVLKTRNKHRAMLLFALSRGFSITGVEERPSLEEYRVLLKKSLQ